MQHLNLLTPSELHPMKFSATSRLILASLTLLLPAAASAQGVGYWHTSGNKILDANNQQVRISGLNWYGFETTDAVAHGLSSADYKQVIANIQALGYNTIRIPFSNQMIETPTPSSQLNITYYHNFGPVNTDLQGLNSLQVLDQIVNYAGSIGLKIILDNHRSEAGNSAESNGLWYTGAYPESIWINDWTMLAARYAGNPAVIGFDLRNEPHNAYSGGACWDCGGVNDWHLAAERAGNAVLGVNPHLLLFVEGVDAYNNDYYWWGGNLEGVANSPVTLAVPNQLVYSAHDYGPTEYGQSWFPNDSAASLNAVWSKHWSYISEQGIAPVWLGEFGTTNTTTALQSNVSGSQGLWFQSLISFLHTETALNWTYWAMNGEDNYGLLDSNYDPTPVSSIKQSMLASNQFALAVPVAARVPSPATALSATAASASQINLSWTASATSGATYTVSFGTSANSIGTVLATGLTATSFPATGLNAATTYYFTVTAVSSSGSSAPTAPASATTQSPPAPNAPTNLSATASSASQINLSWTASTTSGVTYTVYRGGNLLASGLTGTSYQSTGLAASTAYTYTVTATANAIVSAASNSATATTQAAAAVTPAAPNGISASPVSASQINISWAQSQNQPAIANITYSVYMGTSAANVTTLLAGGLTNTTTSATGLADGTTYYFSVKAVANGVSSAPSTITSATTQTAPATPPTGVAATAASATEIDLTWTAVTNTGATYSVYSGTVSGATNTLVASGISGTAYAATGLTASTTYYFTIRSVSAGGTSSPSGQASATTQAITAPIVPVTPTQPTQPTPAPSAPTAPANLSASASSTTQVNLSWSASTASNSTSAITYTIYTGASAGSVSTVLASNFYGTSFTVSSLTPGSTTYYAVTATNSTGTSSASNIASATTN